MCVRRGSRHSTQEACAPHLISASGPAHAQRRASHTCASFSGEGSRGQAPSCRKAGGPRSAPGRPAGRSEPGFPLPACLSTCSGSDVRVRGGLTVVRPPRALGNRQNSGTHTGHQLPWKAPGVGGSEHSRATEGFFFFSGVFQRPVKRGPPVMGLRSEGPGEHSPASLLGPQGRAISSCGYKTALSHFLLAPVRKSAVNKQPTDGSLIEGRA